MMERAVNLRGMCTFSSRRSPLETQGLPLEDPGNAILGLSKIDITPLSSNLVSYLSLCLGLVP